MLVKASMGAQGTVAVGVKEPAIPGGEWMLKGTLWGRTCGSHISVSSARSSGTIWQALRVPVLRWRPTCRGVDGASRRLAFGFIVLPFLFVPGHDCYGLLGTSGRSEASTPSRNISGQTGAEMLQKYFGSRPMGAAGPGGSRHSLSGPASRTVNALR